MFDFRPLAGYNVHKHFDSGLQDSAATMQLHDLQIRDIVLHRCLNQRHTGRSLLCEQQLGLNSFAMSVW